MSVKICDFHTVTIQMNKRRECGDLGLKLPLAGYGSSEVNINLIRTVCSQGTVD